MAVTGDQVNAQGGNGTTTITCALTPTNGVNFLVAQVIFSNLDSSSGVTFNGTAMTLLTRITFAGPVLAHEYWGLQAPSTGSSFNCIATKSGGGNFSFARLCVSSYNNVRQVYTLDGSNSNTQSSAAPSISATNTFADSLGIMTQESATGTAGSPNSPAVVISPSGLIVKKGLCAGACYQIFNSIGSQTMGYNTSVTNAYNSMIILDGLNVSTMQPGLSIIGVGA